MVDPTWLPKARKIISYVPVAMYAESLRLNSALVLASGSSLAIPPPLTGCVRDLNRLWHLSPSDVLSDFHLRCGASVASLRHGNSFPLANRAILDRAGVTSRRTLREYSKQIDLASRPVTLHITYMIPNNFQPPVSAVLVCRTIASVELLILFST